MVLIRNSVKVIIGSTRPQDNIGWIVEVDSVSGKEEYQSKRINEGTDLIPPHLTPVGLRSDPCQGLGL